MITRTLTGKTRFREQKRWFKSSLLILQVEEHLTGTAPAYHNGSSEDVNKFEFRDLHICDMPSPAATTAWVTINK